MVYGAPTVAKQNIDSATMINYQVMISFEPKSTLIQNHVNRARQLQKIKLV